MNEYNIPIGNGNYVTKETATMLKGLNYINPSFFMIPLVFITTFFFNWWITFCAVPVFCVNGKPLACQGMVLKSSGYVSRSALL